MDQPSFDLSRGELTKRVKNPSWKDPKFILGIALVCASVLGVVLLVASLRTTHTYYALRSEMSPGQKISEQNLVPVEVNLGASADKYVSAKDELDDSLVLLTGQGAGTLLEKASVGQQKQLARKPLGISTDGDLPASLSTRDSVEVWAAKEAETGGYGTPERIVQSAPIAEIVRPERNFSANNGSRVQLLLTDEELPKVLEAVNAEDKISLVPTHSGGSQ